MGKSISEQEKRRRKTQSQEDAFQNFSKKPKHKKLEPYVRSKHK